MVFEEGYGNSVKCRKEKNRVFVRSFQRQKLELTVHYRFLGISIIYPHVIF